MSLYEIRIPEDHKCIDRMTGEPTMGPGGVQLVIRFRDLLRELMNHPIWGSPDGIWAQGNVQDAYRKAMDGDKIMRLSEEDHKFLEESWKKPKMLQPNDQGQLRYVDGMSINNQIASEFATHLAALKNAKLVTDDELKKLREEQEASKLASVPMDQKAR